MIESSNRGGHIKLSMYIADSSGGCAKNFCSSTTPQTDALNYAGPPPNALNEED